MFHKKKAEVTRTVENMGDGHFKVVVRSGRERHEVIIRASPSRDVQPDAVRAEDATTEVATGR